MMQTEALSGGSMQKMREAVRLMQAKPVQIGYLPVSNGRGLMVEGIAPVRKDGTRDWGSIDGQGFEQYSRWRIACLRITGKRELKKRDYGLYKALLRRETEIPGIMGNIGLEDKRREWGSLSDGEFVDTVQTFVRKNGISGKKELKRAEDRIYRALIKREKSRPGTVNRVFSESESSRHADAVKGVLSAMESFGDDGDAHAQPQKSEQKITAAAVTKVVATKPEKRPRGLLSGLSDEELAGYAEWVMAQLEIGSKGELQDADEGLYQILKKRERERPGIMANIGFSEKCRDWESIGDDEFVAMVNAFMREKGIRGKEELQKADCGMYCAFLSREKASPGITDRVGFERKLNDWVSLGDDEFVAKVQAFINEKGIGGKKELRRAGCGVYKALLQREKERPGIKGKVGLSAKRKEWSLFSDDEIVAFVQAYMMKNGIRGRTELKEKNGSAYYAINRREKAKPGIMDRVFSEIDESNHGESVEAVVGALESFGDDE